MASLAQIHANRLGIKCKPPSLVLTYKIGSETRCRIMPVRFLNKYGSVDRIVEELMKKHASYLEKVPPFMIEKMMRILQETMKGREIKATAKKITEEYSLNPAADLNKLSDSDLAIKKKIMDSSYAKNQIKPGDPNYEYDVQLDYNISEKMESGWDSDNEESFFT